MKLDVAHFHMPAIARVQTLQIINIFYNWITPTYQLTIKQFAVIRIHVALTQRSSIKHFASV